MQTGEDINALRKIIDMTRLISITILIIHFYITLYKAFYGWHWTAGITDRIVENIARTGLYSSLLRPKLAALLLLIVSLLGAKGKKDEQIRKDTIAIYIGAGLLFYFSSVLCFYLRAGINLIAITYISITALGYLLILTGGGRLSRLLKTVLTKDIFNRENETFPQEERKLENEYAINLPAKYQLKNKIRDSWINLINPFRGILVAGTPGAGKSYFVIRHIIEQHIKKGFAMFIYDFKYPDLSLIAYNALLKYQRNYKVKPGFWVIDLDNIQHQCNPLYPASMEDITDASESSRTILLGLNREWIRKQGDFFVESPINKNEEALEERNLILESFGKAFFALDKDWAVTYWNCTAEKTLHKTKQEMLGRNLWDAFPTAVNSAFYRNYHQAVKTNRPVHFEDYFALLDCWYEVSAFPSPAGLSVYFKDISERKKIISDLKESERRYSDVFHFSPLPMWVVNLESLAFLDVNEATIKHYGYTRAEFLTMTLRDVRPESELVVLQRALDQGDSEPGTLVHRQMIHRKKNGELMNMDIQIAPFLFKGVKTSIVIATDMTERLRYVKAIEQQNEKLIAISWMQSHVIRAPLARVMGLIPMFIDPKTTSKERLDISEYLVQSANEMDEVIKNITEVTCTASVN